MHTTSAFVSSLSDSPEVLQLKPLLTPILNLLQKCIQNGEEAAAAEGNKFIYVYIYMHIYCMVFFNHTDRYFDFYFGYL